MKHILSLILCLTMLFALAFPQTVAADGEGWYVVDSDKPRGYCYLYSKPSSADSVSRNLGRYDNGEYVYVLEYDGGNGYCYVQTQDGKSGYIHDYALTRYYGDVWTNTSSGWYMVQSKSPNGYCYLYSQPTSKNGVGYNMGRHDNGELVYVLEYDGGNGYCRVQTTEGEIGYMNEKALVRFTGLENPDPRTGWYTVYSTKPNGYCYLYSAASDRDEIGYNMGRYDNGEFVYVLEYEGGKDGRFNYCYVLTQDGKYGFMHDYALTKY